MGAQTPPIFANIQLLGALRRFKCLLGPRVIVKVKWKRCGFYKIVKSWEAGEFFQNSNRLLQVSCQKFFFYVLLLSVQTDTELTLQKMTDIDPSSPRRYVGALFCY